MIRRLTIFTAVLLGATASAATAETLLLKNFTLIDGRGGVPVQKAAMLVDNGRIRWVGAAAKAPRAADSVVDLKGKYVMPGLIDTHVHIGAVHDLTQKEEFYTRENVEKDLKTFASYGVTTVASMGTDKDLILKLRDEQRAGRPTMARVFTAVQGIVYDKGYGGVPGINRQYRTPAEAVAAVDAQAAKGADYIKLWLDDELGQMPKMPPEMTKAIIDAGHRHKLKVFGHVFYLEDAKRLARQGIDGFVHTPRDKPIDDELIQLMKAGKVTQLAATLSREQSIASFAKPAQEFNDPFFQQGVSPAALEGLRSEQRQHGLRTSHAGPKLDEYAATAREDVRREIKAGIPVGMGTDSGPPGRFGGYFAHWEMSLLVDSGMSPAMAIHSATGLAADLLGVKGIGTLVNGNWADLVVLNADPIRNIANARKIDAVYIAGRKVPSVRP